MKRFSSSMFGGFIAALVFSLSFLLSGCWDNNNGNASSGDVAKGISEASTSSSKAGGGWFSACEDGFVKSS